MNHITATIVAILLVVQCASSCEQHAHSFRLPISSGSLKAFSLAVEKSGKNVFELLQLQGLGMNPVLHSVSIDEKNRIIDAKVEHNEASLLIEILHAMDGEIYDSETSSLPDGTIDQRVELAAKFLLSALRADENSED
ncbi:MAG: hypothetical protein Q7Q71_03530 [Verrucomicrobiota bacterium JB023]|nr:hypothetical protein [Verrucomicrobiota bacterium JB023]